MSRPADGPGVWRPTSSAPTLTRSRCIRRASRSPSPRRCTSATSSWSRRRSAPVYGTSVKRPPYIGRLRDLDLIAVHTMRALVVHAPLVSPEKLEHRDRLAADHDEVLRPAVVLRRNAWRCCTNHHWPARCQPTGFSPADAIRHGSAEGGHPIEDFAAEDYLTPLPGWVPGAQAISDDGFVSEECILHPALTMVP